MFGTIAKKVDGGQGDAVGGLVDGDHLVFGTIAKKVDGGQVETLCTKGRRKSCMVVAMVGAAEAYRTISRTFGSRRRQSFLAQKHHVQNVDEELFYFY